MDNSKQEPMIELTNTQNVGTLNSKNQHEEDDGDHRVRQPLLLFWAIIITETYTIFSPILLLTVQDTSKVYLAYVILTVIRSGCWLFNSWWLIGFSRPLLRLYLMIDNNTLFLCATIVAYILLNMNKTTQYVLGAMIAYPFLIIPLVGNFRVCLVYCIWRRWQLETKHQNTASYYLQICEINWSYFLIRLWWLCDKQFKYKYLVIFVVYLYHFRTLGGNVQYNLRHGQIRSTLARLLVLRRGCLRKTQNMIRNQTFYLQRVWNFYTNLINQFYYNLTHMSQDCRCDIHYYHSKPQVKLSSETTNKTAFKPYPIEKQAVYEMPKPIQHKYDPDSLQTSYKSTFTKPVIQPESNSSNQFSTADYYKSKSKNIPFPSQTQYKKSFIPQQTKLQKQPPYEYKPKTTKFDGQSSYKAEFVQKTNPDAFINGNPKSALQAYQNNKPKIVFDGTTSYKSTFQKPELKVEKQPQLKYIPKNVKFEGESSYNATFKNLPKEAYKSDLEYCSVHPGRVILK